MSAPVATTIAPATMPNLICRLAQNGPSWLRRWAASALLLALAATLTGCVYLRLLALQGQLAEFDRYVTVRDEGDLILEFRKPVLSGDDLRWLIKLSPTSVTSQSQGQTWQWTFVKQRPATSRETGNFDMSFGTVLTSNKMSQFVISQRFLTFMPKPMILGLARSAGRADIDRKKRSAHLQWRAPAAQESAFPTQRELEQLLGEPFEIQEQGGRAIHLYRYTLDTPTPAPPEKKAAWARFHFHRTNAALARIEADFAGFKINLALDAARDTVAAK